MIPILDWFLQHGWDLFLHIVLMVLMCKILFFPKSSD
jgi:hypothetical protein